MRLGNDKGHYRELGGRLNTVTVLLVLGLMALGIRLWELQILRAAEFGGKSDRNRLRIQRLEPPRGVIYGRMGGAAGVVLADNRIARDLMFVPADSVGDPLEVCRKLEDLVGIDAQDLLNEIQRAQDEKQPHRQIVVRKDVPRAVAARVEEYGYALPGVFTLVRPIRRYVYGKTAGQVLGYLGEINVEELRSGATSYALGDLVGRSGLERVYESTLRGKEGRMLVTRYAVGEPQLRTDPYGRPYVENLVDSYGHSLRVEEDILEAAPGGDLHIALDMRLQKKAEELLEGKEGSIVVLDAETGAVLALASVPGFDPTVFVTRSGNRIRQEILTARPYRMLHRAFQENYAPGSIFKILLAAAALEEGLIDENTSHYCTGRFLLAPGERPWHCWNRAGHGEVGVVDALAFSCDVYFYNVGLKLGVDRIKAWSGRFGLGERTGIDLPGEVAGLVPSRSWKEDMLRPSHPREPWEYRWYPGDTINLSIGQGAITTTPLQSAVLMAAMLNGGRRVKPHLRRESATAASQPLLSERTLRVLRKGMRKCVEKGPPAPTGTGREAFIKGIALIGKTGSAQNVSLDLHKPFENEEDIPKELRDHAWFVGGVLDRTPSIAVCVIVEHGHHGSTAAAPLAGELIEYFYQDPISAPEESRVAKAIG